MSIQPNTLFYGDNLEILRDHFPNESVDLIYLDPPFNSQRPYNILFRERSGTESRAQVEAFNDMWSWNSIRPEVMLQHIAHEASPNVSKLVSGLVDAVGETPLMAYVVMMTARLIELHRVLKPTGSLYLHCDPNASHYLKVVLDTIFGADHYRNEIVWKRNTAHSDAKGWGRVHDVIFYYAKSSRTTWNKQFTAYEEKHLERFSRSDPDGRKWTDGDITAKGLSGGGYTYAYKGITSLWRVPPETMERLDSEDRLYFTSKGGIRLKRYLDELQGTPIQDVIVDIFPINSQASERLGYPTQKPLALLERIIEASSNPGDIVLDPFCGCGTAIAAAEKLDRQWYGIDITHLAIAVQEQRLKDMFPGIAFHVEGVPKDVESARAMATRDYNGRAEFQYWAVSLVNGYPFGSTDGKKGKKGKDRGIDGYYTFYDEADGRKGKDVIIQVKSGKVSSRDIRDLGGTMSRENASIGLFVTLEPPTSEMNLEAYRAGEYLSPGWNQAYQRIQILTIEELLNGKRPHVPARTLPYKQAEKVGPQVTQHRLDMHSE